MVYYKDNEIKIRDIINEDIINLFSWWIDKEININDPRPIPSNSKDLKEECDRYCDKFEIEIMNKNIEERKYNYYIIVNSEDLPIGFVNFFSIDKIKKQGEMGITIGDKRYWRKGIAYKAVNVVIDHIFDNMDIDRIYIEASETNTPSLKLFEKLNFKRCDQYVEDKGCKFIVMEKRQ